MKLFKREILDQIRPFYHTSDVVVIQGARQVGKTSLMHLIKDELQELDTPNYFLDLEDHRFLSLLDQGPEKLIGHLKENGVLNDQRLYLFIDEIQYLSDPSNFLKLMHDHYADRIKLFVSGSSSFEVKRKFKDSLVGRTISFILYPLKFSEFLTFRNAAIDVNQKITSPILQQQLVEYFIEFSLYGGYPRIVLESDINIKEKLLSQIIQTYIRKDIRDLADIRSVAKFNKLLETLASQCGQILNVLELSGTVGLSRQTIENYLFILENTFIIKRISPFSRNVRSELFKSPKIFFLDNGIAHLLWLKTFPKTILGEIFENSVFTELLKQQNADIYYWRTQDKKEIDFILRKGRALLPIEVKLNAAKLKITALNFFRSKYDVKELFCVTLQKNNSRKDVVFRYPWECCDP